MIELSKCPNCASEDRVTIAGKDFCMRCGTASQDNAMIAAAQSGYAQNPPVVAPNENSVAKFNSTPQPSVQPNQAQDQLPPAPAAVTQAAPQPVQAQDNPASPSMNIEAQPLHVVASPVPPSAPPQQPSQVSADNPSYQRAVTAADNKIDQLSTLPAEVNPSTEATASNQQQPPTTAPIPVAISSASTANPLAGPSVPSAMTSSSSPAPMISVDPISPLTSTASIANQSTQANTMPGSSVMMSLDKNEPGVFSDEELHELSNTKIESPIATRPEMTAEKPAFVPTQQQQQQQASPQKSNTMRTLPSSNQAGGLPQGLQLDNLKSDKPKSSKVLKPLGVAASILLVFLAGYYLWRTNYPSLAFKIASSKAGISATMPGYVPDGFQLSGNIQSSPGSVSYNLQNPGSRKIQITQSKTDWDSQALAENYISPKADNYIALQAQGLTIYMMGTSQANWVNKGTWYRIESPSSSLTQEQVIKMATSL